MANFLKVPLPSSRSSYQPSLREELVFPFFALALFTFGTPRKERIIKIIEEIEIWSKALKKVHMFGFAKA